MCACVSFGEKGKKSQLVPLKNSFSEDFQKLQIWFWNWPCTRPSSWYLDIALSISKNNPHILWRICNTLHCALCTCMCKYDNIHRKYPYRLFSDLMKFFFMPEHSQLSSTMLSVTETVILGFCNFYVAHHGFLLYDANINTLCYNVGLL